jgi:HPt (histidine-containing phosphotransfer) domain-containing protein
MREMFIEKGFDDFLAKPIDVSKLEEILDRWISKEKKERRRVKREQMTDDSHFMIPGIDTAKGISGTGGTEESYRKVLNMFCKDVQERLPLLQTAPQEDTLFQFIIHIHALKTALATLGAAEISAKAAALEVAGNAKDLDSFRQNLPDFVQHLAETARNIQTAMEIRNAENKESVSSPSSRILNQQLVSLFHDLDATLKAHNAAGIDRVLEEISRETLAPKTKETIEQISMQVLMAEYESAKNILDGLLGNENNS